MLGDGKEPSTSSSSIPCSQPCRRYEFDEIVLATNNFHKSHLIGHGGFGKVYKGKLMSGSSLVVAAIKRLDPESGQGAEEFLSEIKILSEVRHCNLVSLLGYCNYEKTKEMILVYEYMPNGSLEDHLHKPGGTPLSFLALLKICIDTARGLDYLHTGTGIDDGVIHRDIKSSNILIDESFAAKVSDFGLSRRGPKNHESAYVYTVGRGTYGYLDPQFYSTGYGRLTRKSDVYAFGVVLLEVLCRKRAVFGTRENAKNLGMWAQECINKGDLMRIIDTDVKSEISSKYLKKFAQIALKCLHKVFNQRSTMAEVVVSLETLQGEINSSMQPARKTIFGKMVDKFKADNTVHGKGGATTGQVDNNTLIPVAFQEYRLESFQGHDEMLELREIFNSMEYGEGSRYKLKKVIGKGGSGVVCSAYDTHLHEKVAIKKINDIFQHVSVAVSVLREIKLLRLLQHQDIVEIKNILLPPSMTDFKDIYVVFELMDSDLHQVIKSNNNLTPEHHRLFLYQILRGLKYIHTANVIHRDLKPQNILVNIADLKLKICDFGISRTAFSDQPTATFWTDYVGARWYRAPELCGSFFSKYTAATDMWSIGCIFAEVLTGKPLFPGRNVVHQLELITDLLGTPSPETISRIRNDKAKRHLSSMRKKNPVSFLEKFPNADLLALPLLKRLIAFDPKDRPTVEEALSDPYFKDLGNVEREPSAQPITKMQFEFEKRKNTKEDLRELIYREILEYHPNMLKEYLDGTEVNHQPAYII